MQTSTNMSGSKRTMMPMPEKILDEKAEPKKSCEDLSMSLVSNQTAPASGMSNKVDEMVTETKRLSIEEKPQEPENKPAELKESKSKLAAQDEEAKPVEQPEAEKPKEAEASAEVKPSEQTDSKKRPHAEITNSDVEMQQQTKLDGEAEKQSKRLKIDDVVPAAVAEEKPKDVVPATAEEPAVAQEKKPEEAVGDATVAKPSESKPKLDSAEKMVQPEVQNPEPVAKEAKPATVEEKPASPSVMKDIPASKMQQEAFAPAEAAPETKAAAEEPKVSSTTELEKAYIADVNKESSKAPAEANPEPANETTEKKD